MEPHEPWAIANGLDGELRAVHTWQAHTLCVPTCPPFLHLDTTEHERSCT